MITCSAWWRVAANLLLLVAPQEWKLGGNKVQVTTICKDKKAVFKKNPLKVIYKYLDLYEYLLLLVS